MDGFIARRVQWNRRPDDVAATESVCQRLQENTTTLGAPGTPSAAAIVRPIVAATPSVVKKSPETTPALTRRGRCGSTRFNPPDAYAATCEPRRAFPERGQCRTIAAAVPRAPLRSSDGIFTRLSVMDSPALRKAEGAERRRPGAEHGGRRAVPNARMPMTAPVNPGRCRSRRAAHRTSCRKASAVPTPRPRLSSRADGVPESSVASERASSTAWPCRCSDSARSSRCSRISSSRSARRRDRARAGGGARRHSLPNMVRPPWVRAPDAGNSRVTRPCDLTARSRWRRPAAVTRYRARRLSVVQPQSPTIQPC